MDKFSFVIHNTDWKMIARAFDEPLLGFEKNDSQKMRMAERAFRWTSPFKYSTITGIRSKTGAQVEGYFIFSMLVPEQFLGMKEDVVLRHLEKAGEISKKNGSKILGLGAYSALVGKRGVELAKRIDMPVTTGSTYTVAALIDAVCLAAEHVKLDTKSSNCVIVGATGKIGCVCAKIFAKEGRFKKLTLVARNLSRLDNLRDSLKKDGDNEKVEITTTVDLKSALKEGDVVIFTTNFPETMVDENDFSPGAIVCDASVPKNVPLEIFKKRDDMLLFEGGIIKPPGNVDFNFYFGPDKGFAYACIAETMILALEKRFENYSLGSDIDINKVMEIREMAEKHGFIVEALRTQYGCNSEQRIGKAQKMIAKKKKYLK
ncbi:MAG TPA: shikimate dehydrogenase [Candidatus Omnitrophota bacterium]|nr:shikimate dehydrogenase [Candidatus Omnitrophota bacterium]HPS21053.1 shikimate dehydrogenase [Candidatus Omnitrophota bacterium]